MLIKKRSCTSSEIKTNVSATRPSGNARFYFACGAVFRESAIYTNITRFFVIVFFSFRARHTVILTVISTF